MIVLPKEHPDGLSPAGPYQPERECNLPRNHDLGRAKQLRQTPSPRSNEAKSAGINFIDTAEMYPVPPKAETYATTERYIGNYFKSRGDRTDWILASKIAGPGNTIDYIRDKNLRHNRAAHHRSRGCQPQAPANRLHRPVPAALAGAQH